MLSPMSPQPPTSRLSLKGLLTFPYRLCNPPPAAGKVRSCGLTPILNVRLEDVLARRHLPPIGLKDLEEYLLYVERAPENLYFILWLKDYTTRYNAWVQREKSALGNKKIKLSSKSQQQKVSLPPTPDPSLAMFYLRAKQTFFTPNGEYELNIPSDILAPFHCAPHSRDNNRPSLWHSQSIHPDPAVFSEVAMEVQHMLNESLRRFVRAAYTNVGSQRAICGIIAGCFFTLTSGVLPLVMTTGRWNIGPHGRLVRLAAFPGLWFGLTVVMASLQGICLMIYFFGDLRQLRMFELARPTISRPIPIPNSSSLPSGSTHYDQPLFVPSRRAPYPEKTGEEVSPTLASLDSSASCAAPIPLYAGSSTTSLADASCDTEASGSSVGCHEIDISPAFFDDDPAPEGPATASCLHRPEYRLPPSSITRVEPVYTRQATQFAGLSTSTSATDSPVAVNRRRSKQKPQGSTKSSFGYGPTAGFIPSDYRSDSATSLGETSKSMRSQRSACYFDFDTLPAHKVGLPHESTSRGDSTILPRTGSLPSGPSSPSSPSLAGVGFLREQTQYKCNYCPTSGLTGSASPSPPDDQRRGFSLAMLIPSFTAGVPAFAAPLTPVQSPVVKRAQWEIVVRAGLVGGVIAGALTGLVVGVVP